MRNLRAEFLSIYADNIKREGSDKLLKWLSEESDFFVAPASTRFHGNYEGGLLEHSLNVYHCLKRKLEADGVKEYSEETIAISALLHDICKVNFYKKGTRNVKVDGVWVTKEVYEVDEKCPLGDHGDKSVIILQNLMKLELPEIFAIRAHMGGFDNAVRGGSMYLNKVFETCKLAVYLHMADIEATYLLEKSIK